jgi:histone H3/H4
MAESLVVGSKVKDTVKAAGCNTAGDFADALSAEVACLIKKAAERAQANGRKTVRAADL